MSAQDEPPLGDAASPSKAEQNTGQKVARVAESSLSAVSATISIGAVAAAAVDAIPVAGPLIAVGVTGLLPVVVAAFERRREAHSQRAKRARSYADEAWDAVMAAHGG